MGEMNDLSFDALAERGQYRAFQRAYGKENQAMLGLILLTVAWSYAAHVYGHASVFTWFMRYVLVGVAIYVMYHALLYSHSIFERAVEHYRNWEREQTDALREHRVKEKAKERRKRAKDNENRTGANTATLTEAESEQRTTEVEKARQSKLQEDMEEAQARKHAAEKEKSEARREVERRRKAQEVAAAAAKKAQADAAQKQRAQGDAEQAPPPKDSEAQKSGRAAKTAKNTPPKPAIPIPLPKPAEPMRPSVEAKEHGLFIHPEEAVVRDARRGSHSSIPSEGEPAADRPPQGGKTVKREDLQRAENAVAFAKQEAERAQRQLAMAEEIASRARAHSKGRPQASAPVVEPRNSLEKRNSIQGLRPTHSGSGYVPPHLREGYMPKPSKATLPPWNDAPRERSTSNASRKKGYAAAGRAIVRSPGSSPKDGKDGKEQMSSSQAPSGTNKSPSTPPSMSPEHGADDSNKRRPPVKESSKKEGFESNNVFAMLPDEDGDESD